MVQLDFSECDAQGNVITGGQEWNVNFEAPPRVGETVEFWSSGQLQAGYRVVWVTYVCDLDAPTRGYQLQIGITAV